MFSLIYYDFILIFLKIPLSIINIRYKIFKDLINYIKVLMQNFFRAYKSWNYLE